MLAQPLPFLSQRRHWYAYVIGFVPAHEPEDADSVLPLWAVPVIAGRLWFVGAAVLAAFEKPGDGEHRHHPRSEQHHQVRPTIHAFSFFLGGSTSCLPSSREGTVRAR